MRITDKWRLKPRCSSLMSSLHKSSINCVAYEVTLCSPLNHHHKENEHKEKLQIKVQRSFALIFHKWNKNCFLVIFIIGDSLGFKWKIAIGMKQNSFNQHYFLSYEENLTQYIKIANFLSHNKIKNMNNA